MTLQDLRIIVFAMNAIMFASAIAGICLTGRSIWYALFVPMALVAAVVMTLLIRVWVRESRNRRLAEWQRKIRCMNPTINQ